MFVPVACGGQISGGTDAGGGDSAPPSPTAICSETSKCPDDPAPTPDSITQCKTLATGACGSEYVALASCAFAEQACAADGTTDEDTTSANIDANCNNLIVTLDSCCTTSANACQ